MKNTAYGAIGSALAALIVIIATNGTAFVEAMAGVPLLLGKWTADTPLGVWSLVAGLLIPSGCWLALDRWLPEFRNRHARLVLVEAAVFVVAMMVVFALLPTLPGLLLGTTCGLFAPLLARALKAVQTTCTGLKADAP